MKDSDVLQFCPVAFWRSLLVEIEDFRFAHAKEKRRVSGDDVLHSKKVGGHLEKLDQLQLERWRQAVFGFVQQIDALAVDGGCEELQGGLSVGGWLEKVLGIFAKVFRKRLSLHGYVTFPAVEILHSTQGRDLTVHFAAFFLNHLVLLLEVFPVGVTNGEAMLEHIVAGDDVPMSTNVVKV